MAARNQQVIVLDDDDDGPCLCTSRPEHRREENKVRRAMSGLVAVAERRRGPIRV